jgi:hypothetical protein
MTCQMQLVIWKMMKLMTKVVKMRSRLGLSLM